MSTKKLSYAQCKPLVDKVLSRAKTWTVKYLSYAGRLQLVKTILLSLQSFWCQIFVLPKKVIKEVQSYCRIFLWTGGNDCSKKALVAWSHMCLPKTAGGWNIKDMEIWNKAAVCKLLWAITHKKDRLWSRWVDGYYMKGRSIADVHCPSTMSWSLKKIIGCQELVTNVGGWSAVEKGGCFSIKLLYRKLCGDHPKVPWRRLLCNNLATAKSIFIMWIAI